MPRAYEALCDWLLNISLQLIRPKLQTLSPLCADENKEHTSTGKREFGNQDDQNRNLRPEERFPYFTKRICRARIWGDRNGLLFKRLQGSATDYMDDIAELCHARSELLTTQYQYDNIVPFKSK